jgi:hypothetical protein
MSDPLIPRLHINSCVDHHVISQALFLLTEDELFGDSMLGRAAQELMQYLVVHEKDVHTEHTDEQQLMIKMIVGDLYNRMSPECQRDTILSIPEDNVIEVKNTLDAAMNTARDFLRKDK